MCAILTPPVFVGLDVSKGTLDVFILPGDEHFQVPNNNKFEELIQRLLEIKPAGVILEPTGGYELPVARALTHAGITVYRPHAVRMSYHARASHLLSKTDKLDAKALAHYGSCYAKDLIPYQSDEIQETLKALVQRCNQLVEMKVQELNRFQHEELPAFVQQNIATNIKWLDQQVKQIEKQIREMISCNESLKQRQEIIISMLTTRQFLSKATI